MSEATSWGARFYERLLLFYPEDLRRDYGAEMALVFADDLAAARRSEGTRGAVRVWRCVLGELVRVAIPEWASRPALRAPAIACAFAFVILSAELVVRFVVALMHFPAGGVLWSFAPALVPVAVVWACRGNRLISLDLREPKC